MKKEVFFCLINKSWRMYLLKDYINKIKNMKKRFKLLFNILYINDSFSDKDNNINPYKRAIFIIIR